MFSGIVFSKGRVLEYSKKSGSRSIRVASESPLKEREKGMSVAINGVCLTAVSFSGDREFTAEVSEETNIKTSFKGIRAGMSVNLEHPVTAATMLSGHIVQGHVDCEGKVTGVKRQGKHAVVTFSFPDKFGKYLVDKGSVCVDGTSLTAFDVKKSSFAVSLIPETLSSTIAGSYRPGTMVNLEFDIIGKYVEKQISGKGAR